MRRMHRRAIPRHCRKSGGKESKPSYSGNLLVENRNGLIVEAEVFQANGTAERDAALMMLAQIPGTKPVTVGGDKGFDTRGFVADCRHLRVTPHVAQNHARPGGSALDGRTTRHPGYAISQRKRKRIEECFGWLKTIALMRKVRHRGVCKVDWIFTFACAAYKSGAHVKLLRSLLRSFDPLHGFARARYPRKRIQVLSTGPVGDPRLRGPLRY
jgi:hypothetical protein